MRTLWIFLSFGLALGLVGCHRSGAVGQLPAGVKESEPVGVTAAPEQSAAMPSIVQTIGSPAASELAADLAKWDDPNGSYAVNPFTQPRALDVACVLGNLDAVKSLIKRGAEITSDGGGLEFAVLSGRADIVDALIQGQEQRPVSFKCKDWALPLAAKTGNLPLVRDLLEKGANADASDIDGMTALMRAAEGGYTDIAAELLAHGADVNAVCSYSKYSALSYAVSNGRWETAALLASKGATEAGNGNGLVKAILDGRDNLARAMIKNGADLNQRDGYTTPLAAATTRNNISMAQLLLDTGANPNTAMFSPSAPAELIRLLLSRGADPNLRDPLGKTPLMAAASEGNAEVVGVLLRAGGRPDAGVLSALLSTASSDADIAALLDAASNPPTDGPGRFFLALTKRDLNAADDLFKDGVFVDFQGANGMTPLMCFSLLGNTEVVKFLLSRGADPLRADKSKRTAADWAAIGGKTDLLELLLSPSRLGPALCEAAGAGSAEAVKFLLAKGADPNAKGIADRVALNAAARGSGGVGALPRRKDSVPPVEVVKILIDAGAKIDSVEAGWSVTPLMEAAMKGDMDTLRLLLSHGADPIKAIDDALVSRHFDAVRLLLERVPMSERKKDFDWIVAAPEVTFSVSAIPAFMLLEEMGVELGSVSGCADAVLDSIRAGNPDPAAFLLRHGAKLTSSRSNSPVTILTEACQHGYRDVVKAFLERNVDLGNSMGTEALRVALRTGDIETAKMLLARGAKTALAVPELEYFVQFAK